MLSTKLPLHLSEQYRRFWDQAKAPVGTKLDFNYTVEALASLGINPDYLDNHRTYTVMPDPWPEMISVPPSEASSSMPSLPRASTPVPTRNIAYEFSFLDDHCEKFWGKWIMCGKKTAARTGREICMAQPNNIAQDVSSAGYILWHLKGNRDLPEDQLKWERVGDVTKWVPAYGNEQNHDRLWVILEGKEAGHYCKAVSCTKPRNNSSDEQKFVVALADVKVIDGLTTTVINTEREHLEVYPTHVAAIWQPDEVKKREPDVYVKAKAGRDAKAAKRRVEKSANGERVKRSRKEIEASKV
jgi:hypothetical protein